MSGISTFDEEYGYTTIVERRIFEDEFTIGTSQARSWAESFNRPYGYLNRRINQHFGSSESNDNGRVLPSEIGALTKLLVVPVDIFCEIAAYLEPYDILNLARSTRELNRFLMSKESRGIWRMARSAMQGMPECPPDLSEAEYARLLFETDTCHACLRQGETRPYFSARARLCYICPTNALMKLVELKKYFPELKRPYIESLLACVPFHTLRPVKDRNFSDEVFYVPRVISILKKFKKFKESCPAKLIEPIGSHKCTQDYVEWYKESKASKLFLSQTPVLSMEAVVKHSAEMDQWLHDYKQMMRIESSLASTVQRHQAAIHNKLIALGYSEEDFPGDWDTEWEEIMSNPQSYTAETWPSILETLEECIARERERREGDDQDVRQAMREEEVMTFFDAFKAKPTWMNRSDALLLPSIEKLVLQEDYSQPITMEVWEAAAGSISRDIWRYEQDVLEYLLSLVKPYHPEMKLVDYKDLLSRPTTMFKCKCCSDSLITYPALLGHNKYLATQRLVRHKITFDFAATDTARYIALSMNVDPNTELASLGKQFQCLRCDPDTRGPMTWTGLVAHFMQKMKQPSVQGPSSGDSEADHILNETLPAVILSEEDASALDDMVSGRNVAQNLGEDILVES